MHPLGSIRPVKSRGTVSLVALCFVAVLGISLASYIAVCSRAMQLSNRSFQAGVSQQLAEAGIEEALRAFNQNNWDDWTSGGISVDWTLDTTNKRATATMTFPTGKFGQGTTGSIKLRVDNYDANVLGVSWNNTKNYRAGDIVERNGIWYRSMRSNTSQTPNGMANMAYWVPDPIPSLWDASVAYKAHDVVFYAANNTWYRYTNGTSTTGNLPTDTTYWTSISKISIDNGYSSINREILNYFGTWYYYSSGWRSTPNPPNSYAPVISWCWRYPYDYSFNDLVCYGYPAVWYRCKVAHTSSSTILPTNTTYWENALSGSMHGWNSSSINYNLGDAVYSSGQWYRCIRAHTSSTSIQPTNTTYWTNKPLYSPDWDAAKQYSQNDTVRYNGVWYLCKVANNGSNPSTSTTNWASASDSANSWSPSAAYTKDVSHVSYGGVWYRCSATHSNKSPNDTDYWTAAWSNSWGITTGAPLVYAEATVTLTGNPSQRTQLRATLAPAPLFPNAAGASVDLTISAGTGTVDSYDSQLSTYSSSTAGYMAVLAAGDTLAINGTTAVKGYLAWPFGSTPSGISTATTVKGSSSPSSPNVDTTRLSRSPYVPQFDIVPSGNLAASTTWNAIHKGTAIPNPNSANQSLILGTPGATTPSRYYYDGDFRLEAGDSSYYQNLIINGPVVLYIKGSLRIQSTGLIQINNAGSARILYGTVFRIYSGGEIRNTTLDPRKLVLLSDSSSTDLTFIRQNLASPKSFYGLIYSPKIDSSVGIEVEDQINLYGAISAKRITFTDAANLHYDTSLRYATIPGVDQPWTAAEWRELPFTERATMP